MPGPAPGRSAVPAAAVPVKVKMPEPITDPMPKLTKLHRPRLRRKRVFGCSLAATSSAMDLVRVSPPIEVGPPWGGP